MGIKDNDLVSPQKVPDTTLQPTKGYVFRIQRFCVRDRPGIRSTVFLSGCPAALRLVSANPEGWEVKKKIAYMHVDTVMQTVLRDKAFYRQSGGGMALSGGEPSAQPAFSLSLLRAARAAGIARAMEGAGTGDASVLPRGKWRLDVCSFLWLFKHMDPVIHRELCGADNHQILSNLELLFTYGADVTVRMPLIPGENDTEENIASCSAFLQQHHCHAIELMPYHNTARGKYAAQNLKARYDRDDATPEQISAACERFASHGIKTKVSGKYFQFFPNYDVDLLGIS